MSARLAKRQLVEPDYWTCPHGVRVRPEPALTYGPEVADLCDKAGYTPDPQQELGLDLVFAIRPDGSPLAFSGCIICARQNLKSGLFQQCCIGWLFVTEVPEIAWSAHELRTSLNAQTELYRTLESPALSKYLPAHNGRNDHPGMYDTNGKERIELNTEQTVWFQTRTRDGGRGLGKPKVIIDEAFKFKKRTAGALLPILLAQHHPQVLYGSSEPPNDPDAEHLRDVIDRGQNRKSPSMWFLQWRAPREDCADPECTHPKDALARGIDCALDREHLLLRANPTVHRDEEGHALDTGRITLQTLRDLRQELAPDEYMRECLGWPEEADSVERALPGWTALAKETPEPPEVIGLGVATDPDQTWCSLSSVVRGEQHPHLAVTDRRRATERKAFAANIARIQAERGCAVMIRGKNFLIPELEAAGVILTLVDLDEFAQGSADLATAVESGEVEHGDYDELNRAVQIAQWRLLDGRRVFDSRKGDISALEAAALALRGASVAQSAFFGAWR